MEINIEKKLEMQKYYLGLELELNDYYELYFSYDNFSLIVQYKGQYEINNKSLFVFKLLDVKFDIKLFRNTPLELKYLTPEFQIIAENNVKDNKKFGGQIKNSDLTVSKNSLDFFIDKQPYLVVSLVFSSTSTYTTLNNYKISKITKYFYSDYKEKFDKTIIEERATNIRHNQCKYISETNSYYFIYLNNETLQQIYDELKPINLNELRDNQLDDGYYSWVYISVNDNEPILYLSKLETPFEFGNKHIELANKIACTGEACNEYKLYCAGELYKNSTMINFNFLSGSFMVEKTYASDFMKGSKLIGDILKSKNTLIDVIFIKGLDIFSNFNFTEQQLKEYISKYKLQIFTDKNAFINNIKEITNNNSVLIFNDEESCFNFINYFDSHRGGNGPYYKFRVTKKKQNRSKNKNKNKKTNRKTKKSRKIKK
jgi:hypothetical protein